MFDDRLFDIIMEEMMSEFGADVRTDESSLAYNACAKIAKKLEEVYGDMDEINDNLLPDTQDESHLIRYGAERGIDYQYATFPIVKAVFHQSIEVGERFSCADYTYAVTENISGYTYKMQCETEGVSANATLGTLEPIDYIDEWQGGSITEILVAGVDDEDIEEFRQKVIDTFKSTSFGGNRADYRNFINKIDGVGGCKPLRRADGEPNIDIYLIDSGYNVPSDTLIDIVQSAVDPEVNHGAGDGMAPICHTVYIVPVQALNISVSVTVTFDTGYSSTTSKQQIENAINGYLLSLRQVWEQQELSEMVVRVSQIESKILSVEGVLDVADTKLNGSTSNLTVDFKKIPILSEVTINV